jgi:hypothetical protein
MRPATSCGIRSGAKAGLVEVRGAELPVSDMDVLLSSVVDEYLKAAPGVVVLDGINALPQSREVASAIYCVFQTSTIAIGEEQIGGPTSPTWRTPS